MKKLRTVSLEDLDSLSSQEKARLYGGVGDNDTIPPPTIPPTVKCSLPPVTSSPSIGFTISPTGATGTFRVDI